MTLQIASMPNFRDAGGHRTAGDGLMRSGLLYRSDHIGKLSAVESDGLAGLGIKVVYDLRTQTERAMTPDERIPGATHLQLDLMSDDLQAAPAQLLRLLEHPRAASAVLGNGQAAALFIEGYRSVVTLASARAGLGRLYRGLAEERGLPALVHCTTGKDRTGWTCAALQTLLGVPYETVLQDFLASNRCILPKYQSRIDEFAARGGDASLLVPLLTVRPDYLDAAFDQVRQSFGSIERYFGEGLGIDARAQQALRERFVATRADTTEMRALDAQ
jgi:protein-tyrosine phosphatase